MRTYEHFTNDELLNAVDGENPFVIELCLRWRESEFNFRKAQIVINEIEQRAKAYHQSIIEG